MMGSGRPYQNKDYMRLLFGAFVVSIVLMYYSFSFMPVMSMIRTTYIQNIYEMYQHSFQDTAADKAHYSQRVVVTGGLGFIGSHLVDRLLLDGHYVIVVDNMHKGSINNVLHWMGHPRLQIIHQDILKDIRLEADQIYHLAAPTSLSYLMDNPIHTIKVISTGILNMLGLAHRLDAKILYVSSGAGVYGNPPPLKVHGKSKSGVFSDSSILLHLPMYKNSPRTRDFTSVSVYHAKESYWGHVQSNTYMSSSSEAVRAAETMVYAYKRRNGVDVRVARLFHTFGPRMSYLQRLGQTGYGVNSSLHDRNTHGKASAVTDEASGMVGPVLDDGSFVGSCIAKALLQERIVVPGNGLAMRTLTFVDDVVTALITLMNTKHEKALDGPVNIGSHRPASLLDIANYIVYFTNSSSRVTTEYALLNKKESSSSKKSGYYVRKQDNIGHVATALVPDVSLAKEVLGKRGVA